MDVIRRSCGRFMKLKSKSVSADSLRIAEYSKQNDVVLALGKENKYWKEKYIQENKFRRQEVEILEAEVLEIKTKASEDMKTEGARYRSLLEEARRKEAEHALECREAEDVNQKLKTELCAKINDMKFQHGLEKIRLEEEYEKESRALKNACEEVKNERKKDREEFEEEMNGVNARLEQARSETGRLKSAVARLREAREIDKAVSEMMDWTYIQMTLKEKDDRCDELTEKLTELSEEKDRLLREAEEKDRRLLLEYEAKEAELKKEAEERRKYSLLQKKTAAERERAIIRDMKCRIEEIKKKSEEEVEGWKRLNKEVTTNIVREYEERERKLKAETAARGMRMLKTAKMREDELKMEIENQVNLKEEAEMKVTMLREENQKLAEEKKILMDCLENERQGRAVDNAKALEEKNELLDELEQQKLRFLNEKNDMVTEKYQRESEWSEKVLKYEATLRGMTATRATLDKRLELTEAQLQGAMDEAMYERKSLVRMIDERETKFRDQKMALEKEIQEKEKSWNEEKEVMSGRYQSLIEWERGKREGEQLQAAKEKEYLREVIEESASRYSNKLQLLEEDNATMTGRNADLLEAIRAQDDEIKEMEVMVKEIKELLEDSGLAFARDLEQEKQSYECRLKKQAEEYDVKMEVLSSQKEGYEKCLLEERSTVESYRQSVAELAVKAEKNEVGFNLVLEMRTRKHETELEEAKRQLGELERALDDQTRKYTTCQTQLLDRRARVKELQKKIDWQKTSNKSKLGDLRKKHQKEMELVKSQVLVSKGRERDLDAREEELVKREDLVDAKENEVTLRQSKNTDVEFGLMKQETDLKNLKEKLRQDEVMIAERKEEMRKDKEDIQARAAEIENEKERLEELEFEIEKREEELEKEKRRIARTTEKVPTRLPIDRNGFGDGEDQMEFVMKLKKELVEQEWYFLARENQFQNAKLESARYRKKESELQKLETKLQEKEKLINAIEEETQMKNAAVESTMVEVTGIRETLMRDSRYKSFKNRSTQASEEKIAAEFESHPSSPSSESDNVACGKTDESNHEMMNEINKEESNEKNREESSEAKRETVSSESGSVACGKTEEPNHEMMNVKNKEESSEAQKETNSPPNNTMKPNEPNEHENKVENDVKSKPPLKDEESSSKQTKVTIHYNLEDDDATESEPRHTASRPKPVGDERFYVPPFRQVVVGKNESALNQVYTGRLVPAYPPRGSCMPPQNFNGMPPPLRPRFFRPPPPGMRPFLRPPFGRPMPRGGPFPRPPPPRGPGFFRPPPPLPFGRYGRVPPQNFTGRP